MLLGVGDDTRAYGFFQRDGVTFFELDQAAMPSHKHSVLAAAGLDR
ncbi:MAG: class I SAM-dependent methyltransferase [Myxococcota bacterium]|nr:class I SAM-dependent methyltransferase [Myxococcota bacterium]